MERSMHLTALDRERVRNGVFDAGMTAYNFGGVASICDTKTRIASALVQLKTLEIEGSVHSLADTAQQALHRLESSLSLVSIEHKALETKIKEQAASFNREVMLKMSATERAQSDRITIAGKLEKAQEKLKKLEESLAKVKKENETHLASIDDLSKQLSESLDSASREKKRSEDFEKRLLSASSRISLSEKTLEEATHEMEQYQGNLLRYQKEATELRTEHETIERDLRQRATEIVSNYEQLISDVRELTKTRPASAGIFEPFEIDEESLARHASDLKSVSSDATISLDSLSCAVYTHKERTRVARHIVDVSLSALFRSMGT